MLLPLYHRGTTGDVIRETTNMSSEGKLSRQLSREEGKITRAVSTHCYPRRSRLSTVKSKTMQSFLSPTWKIDVSTAQSHSILDFTARLF